MQGYQFCGHFTEPESDTSSVVSECIALYFKDTSVIECTVTFKSPVTSPANFSMGFDNQPYEYAVNDA